MRTVLGKEQQEMFEKIRALNEDLSELTSEYWYSFSNMSTWQFWVILVFMFLGPLVAAYFLIDRKNIFQIGFYGFNINVWFSYIDAWGIENGLWGYPYQLTPFFPGNLSIDAALVPVLFMLVYQWTLHNRKRYYLYTLALSVFLSFAFKPLLSLHHFFELHKGTNYLHIFIAYCFIFMFSKLITNVFVHMNKEKGDA